MTEIQIDPAELDASASWLRDVTGQLTDLSGDLTGVCCCEVPPGLGAYVDSELGAAGSMVGEAASGYGVAAADLATRSALITNDQSLVGAMSSAYGPAAPTVDDTGTSSWLSGVSGDGPVTDATGWSPGDWTAAVTGDGAGTTVAVGTGNWTDAVSGDGAGGTFDPGNLPASWMGGMSTPVTTMSPQTIAALNSMHGGAGSAPSATLAGAFPGILGGGTADGPGSTMIKLQTALGSTNATLGANPGIHVDTAGNFVDNANRVTNSLGSTQYNPTTGTYDVVR